jgi:hypothetical protein
VVHTIGIQSLYMFFFISHLLRELVQFNVTASPTVPGSGGKPSKPPPGVVSPST